VSKKSVKLSMGYRPTNSNSYTIDSLYRVCLITDKELLIFILYRVCLITDKESRPIVIGYHDHL